MASIVDISQMAEDDIPAVAAIPALAMHVDLISRAMFGFEHEIESATDFNKGLLQSTYNLPNHHIMKATLKATGEVVGMAQIELQDGAMAVDVPMNALPAGTNMELCGALFGGLGSAQAKHMTGMKHVALHSLHVLPAYQQKGIGSELLRRMFETYGLDKEPIWVNTQLRGRGNLYLKYGWQDMEVVDIDLATYSGMGRGFGIHRTICMLRRPGELKRL